MNRRIWTLWALIVLAIAGFVAWRSATKGSDAARSFENASSAPLDLSRAEPVAADLAASDASVTNMRTAAAPMPSASVTAIDVAKSSTLRVQVISKETRRPLPYIQVTLSLRVDDSHRSAKTVNGSHGSLTEIPITGDDGRVDLDAPPERELLVSGDAFDRSASAETMEVERLAVGETREIVLELATEDDLVFCGRVIDRETRQPIGGVRVRIAQAGGDHGADSRKTDADGRFQVSVASWRSPDLEIAGDGYAPARVLPQNAHNVPQKALVILLDRAATLRVHAVDAGGAPIGGARVALSVESYHITQPRDSFIVGEHSFGDWAISAITDDNGRAELRGIPPNAPLKARLERESKFPHREADPITMNPGEVRELEWKLNTGCIVRGRVIDQNSKPVARCTMLLMRPTSKQATFLTEYSGQGRTTCETDAEGHFTLNDVATGSWWIGPSDERRGSGPAKPEFVAPIAQLIEITEGEIQRDIEIRTDRGLYIRGRVLDPSGNKPSFAGVSAVQIESRLLAYVNTDQESEFTLGPLTSGRYRLSADSHGEFCKSDEIECDAGAIDIVLHLKSGGKIRGTVIDGETGQPTSAIITHSSSTKANDDLSSQDTQADGTFTLDGLEPDAYWIVAHDTRDRFGFAPRTTVAAGQDVTGVVITLVPGARLRVRYAGEELYANLTVRCGGAVVVGDGIQNGTAMEFGVPAGSITVTRSSRGIDRKIERTLDIAAGETKDIVFDKDAH